LYRAGTETLSSPETLFNQRAFVLSWIIHYGLYTEQTEGSYEGEDR